MLWNCQLFSFEFSISNRGYAVLQVNFRGSTGFGRSFSSAGDGEWGNRMQQDLHDAVHFLVQNEIAAIEHLAIMGIYFIQFT